jgi:hypothetical protein
MSELSSELVEEAVAALDEILERYAAGYVLLDRGQLIERIERIRESAVAARLILTEKRSVRLE